MTHTEDADADIILTDDLRRKDERLTTVIFDAVSDPKGDVKCYDKEAPTL